MQGAVTATRRQFLGQKSHNEISRRAKMIKAGVFNKLTLILLIGCISSAAMAQAVVVNIQVNDDETALTVTSPGNCPSDNHPGCVNNNGRGQAPISFNLTGRRNCSTGGQWELEYVGLGMANKTVGNITAQAATDFNADQTTGRVTPDNSSANQILMRNNNSGAYVVWYTVFATCPNAIAPISTDPRIENDGSGRPQ